MLIVYLLITMTVPVLIFFKDFILSNTIGRVSYQEWIQSTSMISSIVMFIMDGFYLTNSICGEYQNKSILNSLAVAPRKTAYIFSKCLVYFLVHIISILIVEIFTITGCALLYREISCSVIIKSVMYINSVTGILSFFVSLFLLWIIILQRDSYYPSLLINFACALLLGSGISMDEKISRIIPWSAVMVFTYSKAFSIDWIISGISVFLCFFAGILLSIILFYKQDL